MKKINESDLRSTIGKGWADDVDKTCSMYGTMALYAVFGAKTVPIAVFCAGWDYGRSWI
jgi:hypothetical protein